MTNDDKKEIDIEKEQGYVGLITCGMKKNIPFVPVSLQEISPIKLKWRKLWTGKEYEYKYNPKEDLFMNVLHYAHIADTFTTEEIRYIFGKRGERKLEEMTRIGYFDKGLHSQITERQWKEFTRGR